MNAMPTPEVPDFSSHLEECVVCGKTCEQEHHGTCNQCTLTLGEHIAKMLCDPFDYAIGLKSGVILRVVCGDVQLKGQWLHIPQPEEIEGLPYPMCRGMQIHLSQIAWVADAPEGS